MGKTGVNQFVVVELGRGDCGWSEKQNGERVMVNQMKSSFSLDGFA